MRPFHRLRRTGQPHLVRSIVLSVAIVILLGTLAGGVLGKAAVKVFELVPFDTLSQPPGSSQGR
jgi:hypothetical protein